MAEKSDVELVRKSSFGDREAFAELVRRYSNYIYGTAYSLLGDFHAAQDVAQETFVKAWFGLERLQDYEKFGSWMASIARRICHDRFRKRKLAEEPLAEAAEIPNAVSLDEFIVQRADSHALWSALTVLDEKYRTTTLLYYMSGMNAREIAKVLEVPIGTIESRLKRSKILLKKELIHLMESTQENKLGEEFVRKVKARIKNALQVRLVLDMSKAKDYYINVLGFTVDGWGHTEREGVGFLLQQAERKEDVRPNVKPSKMELGDWQGPPTSWDTYAYSDFDGVQALYEEFRAKGAMIAYDPIVEDMGERQWKEFAVRDLDGYIIVFGGGN
ncbi:sigma-70 family RNA polymerase sigma factor [Cohnella sp. REN36]|uniref:sigma-70 family RNA polymerase sigma factor n=1 Tax=Cohnella sp. REN36 TaxID=2887347 RepID=UPI001D13745E|nr:sigma-70 family RNA polymerase sigma factor [Cohnella sp. REN36]MCC3373578.1 sigma-70 family RNA polymerase sigma factor [Cohnella sp. REN36]